MSKIIFVLMLTFSFIGSAFANDLGISKAELKKLKADYKRPKEIPYIPENPYSYQKYELGLMLFFDPRLSGSKTQSCATCHAPNLGWGDGQPKGIGDKCAKRPRKTQTLLNIAWDELFNWEGKTEFLHKQVPGLLKNPDLINIPVEDAVKFLKSNPVYSKMFKEAFPKDKAAITGDNIGKAIDIFERGIVSGTAPFDKWIDGNEHAISHEAKKGFVIFNKQAKCAACHSGWRFSDAGFHDIGLKSDDIGRAKFVKIASMQHAFKTPTLRNIEIRAPYMHDGSLKNLSAVIDHYNGGFVKRDSLSAEVKNVHLTPAEKKHLLAFLKTLSSQDEQIPLPILP